MAKGWATPKSKAKRRRLMANAERTLLEGRLRIVRAERRRAEQSALTNNG